jgi:hypothetical protein
MGIENLDFLFFLHIHMLSLGSLCSLAFGQLAGARYEASAKYKINLGILSNLVNFMDYPIFI